MGTGALLEVISHEGMDHLIKVSGIKCMYDNGDQGSNLQVFNDVTLPSYGIIPSTGAQYIESINSDWCAFGISSFTLEVYSGNEMIGNCTILEYGGAYDSNNVNGCDVQMNTDNNPQGIIITVQ